MQLDRWRKLERRFAVDTEATIGRALVQRSLKAKFKSTKSGICKPVTSFNSKKDTDEMLPSDRLGPAVMSHLGALVTPINIT